MAKSRSTTRPRPATGRPRDTARQPATTGRATKPEQARPTDALDRQLATAQRVVLAVVVVLAGVLLWRGALDPFMLPKLTAVALGAVTLLTLAGIRAARLGAFSVPSGAPLWMAVALAVALIVATVTADNVALSLVGQHRRYAGLLPYLAYLVVFLTCVRLYADGQYRGLQRALFLTFAVVTGYGLLQVAGLDPYTWSSNGLDQTFSTMGNINFAAGYLAAVAPVLAAASLLPGWSRTWRLAGLGLLLLGMVYLVVNGSAQGPIAATSGLLVVGAAWVRARHQAGSSSAPRSPSARAASAAGLALGLAAAAAFVVRLGPQVVDSFSERRYFYRAALGIFADRPVLGTGLDSFRDYFTMYRAPEHAVLLGFDNADSVHSLPLSMLVTGGVLLATAYLAFVVATGWVLVVGLRTVGPQQLPALAAFGGMWVAYQVQSLVSVDVPALTFLHFLSAGLVFAVARPAVSTSVRLPLPPAARGAWLPRRAAGARRLGAASLAVVVLVGLAAAWTSTRPLRADLAAGGARAAGDEDRRVDALDRAVELAPWEGEYRILQGQARLDAGQQDEANESVVAAAELRRGSSRLALGAADFARRRGDEAAASFWIEEALRRDPVNPALLDEVAEIFRAAGDVSRADQLVAEAARLRAEHDDY